ncbi:MAG TPA: hypothetical protein VJL31_13040 [Gemmatimonadales bacterium]|nr:hypothetical protein [Gemmatimonadales bacterium]
MAYTIAQTLNNVTVKQCSVIATADADAASAAQTWVALGGTAFAAAPLYAIVTAITAAGGLSSFAVTTMTAGGFTLQKTTAVGSGAAPIQALVTFFLTPVAFPQMSHPVQGVNPWATAI